MNLDPIILAELQRGGPPPWVAGRTYPKGWEVRSLVNLQRYVRKVAGAGDTDPSADAANWEAWSKSLDQVLAKLSTSANLAALDAKTVSLATSVANLQASVNAIAAAGVGIKSVQRGVTDSSTTVSIAAVNLSKSILFWSAKTYWTGSSFMSSNAWLSASNQISIHGYNPNQAAWQVVEFN